MGRRWSPIDAPPPALPDGIMARYALQFGGLGFVRTLPLRDVFLSKSSSTMKAHVRVDAVRTCSRWTASGSPIERPPINSAFHPKRRGRRQSGADGPVRAETTDRLAYRSLNNRTVSGQAPDVQLVDALQAHVTALKGENETLKEQLRIAGESLAASKAQLEKQAAEFAERFAQHSSDIAAERAQTEKAIVEFSAFAERLAALAEERSRPWWRRMIRG